MSRSLNDLRYELKAKGKVRVPHTTAKDIFAELSLAVAPAAIGVAIWRFAPFNWGILSLLITLFASSIIVFAMSIHGWRKHVTVTPTHVHRAGERSIPWQDIEAIRTPVANFVFSIQLSTDGFLRHFDQRNLDPEERAFLESAEDRVIVWTLPQFISPDEIRFLREQVKR